MLIYPRDACRLGSCTPLQSKHMLIYPRDASGVGAEQGEHEDGYVDVVAVDFGEFFTQQVQGFCFPFLDSAFGEVEGICNLFYFQSFNKAHFQNIAVLIGKSCYGLEKYI